MFDDLEMGGSAENPHLQEEKENKEKSLPTTPVSERLTSSPALLRSLPFETRRENVPDYV